jgi:carboxypeptidase C (cathepsin A)
MAKILAFWVLLCVAQLSLAQTPPAAAPAKEEKTSPVPPEKSAVTHHELLLDGRTLIYSATAGTLLIHDNKARPYGSFFYVAYTLDGVADLRTRPVTFIYNGGPGSASIWLHMGSIGPVRVATDSPNSTGGPPYDVMPNSHSILDKSDLVFIDAVGTGFSRPVGKAKQTDFNGTDADVKAFDRFITRYVTVNQRWNSPKYLFGESYGTTRSAALVESLINNGMYMDGLILMSTILNYYTRSPGLDNEYIGYLPTYAATAWYYNKIPNKPEDMKVLLDKARAFARGPYAEALAQGHNLPDAQVELIASQLSALTGLRVSYIKECNLRISPTRFRKELLRDDRQILGRYDARFEGTDSDAAGDEPGYDPSSTGITGAFVSAFHDYLTRDLKYLTDETYFASGPGVNIDWDHSHNDLPVVYVAGDLADAMRKNPHLRVLSVNGLFDLATPFFLTEFDFSHMQLEPKLRANIQLKYYPSGHMIYLNVEALKQLKVDLAGFYSDAAPAGGTK